jgi:hypothetical protein
MAEEEEVVVQLIQGIVVVVLEMVGMDITPTLLVGMGDKVGQVIAHLGVINPIEVMMDEVHMAQEEVEEQEILVVGEEGEEQMVLKP